MQMTITFSAFCDAFRDMGRDENFSYAGKRALFDYLEEVAPDMELDVIAICCEFYESDIESIISDYSIDVSEAEGDEDEISEIVEDYLRDNTMIVGKLGNGSFVYAAF